MMILTVAALVVLVVVGGIGARMFPHAWEHRRHVHLFILAAPGACLLLAILILATCFARALTCFARLIPCLVGGSWLMGSQVALIALTLIVLSAGLLATGRLMLLGWLLGRRSVPATQALQRTVGRLAIQMGIAPPTVRMWAVDRPLALTCGLVRPSLVFSPWILGHLDQHELEAVIAHELAHVARQDQRVLALATWLRDAFWYVPTSRLAWRLLREEQEFVSDDRAVRLTRRPLALASALAKVWHAGVALPGQGYAPALITDVDALEIRIARLTALPRSTEQIPVAMITATPLLAASTRYTAILVTLASCGLMATLWWFL